MDYASLQQMLRDGGLPMSPAECHGTLCGLLCSADAGAASAWSADMLETATGEAVAVQTLRDGLAGITDGLAVTLADPVSAAFQPLLPDDRAPMSERTEALSSWVESFLGGLGMGGVGQAPALSEEASEALDDLAQIARLEREEAEDEALEAALVEVQEYLRVVVQLLYAELTGEGEQEGAPEDATLH